MLLKNKFVFILLFFICITALFECSGSERTSNLKPIQVIRADEIPSDSVLLYGLVPNIKGLGKVYSARNNGDHQLALKRLAAYFKEAASERYYFNWKHFPEKYASYHKAFPKRLKYHTDRSAEMKAMYAPETHWIRPFKNLRGAEVTAYRLRHLARQSKSRDMVFMYFADPGESENMQYWVRQMASLNQAFREGEYDQAGNAVYEVFRAGKRTHQWLHAHHSYLSSDDYSWQDQIETIRTLLHTGAQLAEKGKKVRHGNHHTRGMVSLFEISTLFNEYASARLWQHLAVDGVTWHLEHEINEDGFQFERTVHYHKGDIENYLRVWQLAQRSKVKLPPIYEQQFRKMFHALVVLAQPDKLLPVLQDDTDAFHAETNTASDVMALGTILWQDPIYGYFVDEGVSANLYWLLNQEEIASLSNIQTQRPELSSTALTSTGYYVMRNGWAKDDEYMVINAGLSPTKPDHQHADMLGLVAYADGNEILPNYQVKYNKPDFRFWKNSWTKSVVLVDSIPQAQNWKGNSGGSGFGKWLDLPQPKVLSHHFGNDIDYFAGTHNGFDAQNLTYTREVLFVKDGFWIVRDVFHNPAGTDHEYQQIWQGLFTEIDNSQVKRVFSNGSVFIIKSLDAEPVTVWRHGRYADKGNVMRVQNTAASDIIMTSLLLSSQADNGKLPEAWVGVTPVSPGKINWKHATYSATALLVRENGDYVAIGLTSIVNQAIRHLFKQPVILVNISGVQTIYASVSTHIESQSGAEETILQAVKSGEMWRSGN
ncbi:MAG: heparinase II/III family protein [Candidatus Marinimicrobia bacterium]|nr:heparinase II/III family protein [Candidatus Neomarinimicrobiota bacterium]